MQGVFLRFYVHENRKVHGVLLYEWLLESARKAGIHGGTAFKAMAGYGRHGVLHEATFFELAGDLTVEVEFVVTAADADRLLEIARGSGARLPYARVPAEFGVVEGEG